MVDFLMVHAAEVTIYTSAILIVFALAPGQRRPGAGADHRCHPGQRGLGLSHPFGARRCRPHFRLIPPAIEGLEISTRQPVLRQKPLPWNGLSARRGKTQKGFASASCVRRHSRRYCWW